MEYKSIYTFKNDEKILESKTTKEIVLDYQPLIYAIANKIRCSVGDCFSTDDLVQDANIELIYAFNKYDHSYGVSFNFYIKNILFKTMYTKTMQKIRKIQKLSLGYNDDFASIEYSTNQESAYNSMDNAIELIDFIEFVENSCSKQEQLIIKYKTDGFNQTEISKKLNISQAKVSRILNKIKSEFVNNLLTAAH